MELLYKVESKKEINQVIKDLKSSLSKHDFGVLWELNFKDKLNDTGNKFDNDFFVFEVCNPQQAKIVLDINMEAGFFLPCKLVVYEENSHVYIGMIKPTQLISKFHNKELNEIGEKIENIIIKSIEKAI